MSRSPEFDPGSQVDCLSPLLGLEIKAAQRPQVIRFLGMAKIMADILDAAPVPQDSLELAPVFRPGRDEP